MSSFHTTTNSTSGSCGPYQTAETTANEQSGAAVTSNLGAAGPVASQNLDWIFADVLADWADWPDAGLCLGNPESTHADASHPRFDNSYSVSNNYYPTHADNLAPWLASTPYSESITSPLNDAPWDGNVFPPAGPVTGPQGDPLPCGPAAAIPLPYSDLAWQFESGQFASLTTPCADGDGGVVEPSSGVSSTVGTISWGLAEIDAPHLGVADIGACQATSPRTFTLASSIIGKRPRVAEGTSHSIHAVNDGHGCDPRKRFKAEMATNGVLEAAGSSSRARHNSYTKTPTEINHKFEAAGCGAGGLATLNAQEIYHQSLPGPSVQKELVGTTAQGQLPCVEVREAIRHHAGNAVQQQVCSRNAGDGKGGRFWISRGLGERYKSLLDATPDDWVRESVSELKCRLCPVAGFSKWEAFKRHCEHGEAHPQRIWFCQHCGDFFARKDSLKRHQEKRPSECYEVTPAAAETKRTVLKEVHDVFEGQLEEYLKTNEGTWTPFSQLVKELFPDSSTSKRGSRQQCRIKASRT